MNKSRGGLRAAVPALAVGLMLAGCSNKPPGCATPEVTAVAKQMLTGSLRNGEGLAADDPEGLIASYIERLQVTLVNVVDNGYDDKTHKQSCAGTLQVKAGDGWAFDRPVSYSTQTLVDAPKSFQLEMSEGQLLALGVRGKAEEFYRQRRWSGEWSGTYACQGVGGATEGAAGPYSMPVTLMVDGNAAKLERTTRGGGAEKLEGNLSDLGFRLSGEGKNSPDDRWLALFEGRPHGREAVASGELRGANGEVLRRCELRLTQGAARPDSRPQAPAGASLAWPGSYLGTGDGDVTLEIRPQGADKRYPVSLSTSTTGTGGGCGGTVDGFASERGAELRIVAEAQGQRCEAVAKRQGQAVELTEGAGCNFFHGAACGFSASLTRKP